ncbi:CHAP domain-containing protein [Sphingobium abikonense]|uniref:CHAP domain-containing protein n=1 Tax=Sphingobium abikonense TaxID=86193 RepID=UPI0007869CA6|nr:CHAP domain-containing protein [Sphingobium abikonense]
MIRNLVWAAALMLSGMTGAQAWGASVLQCVPYARTVSGVDLYGDALNWWDQADGRFKRGHAPKKGAVLAFRAFGPMALGHVAVVSRVLDDRRILIRHANWSVPGAIEEDVLAIDVSDQGDWSQVRVWHSPTGQMGARTNPTFGFIYPAKAKLHDFTPDPALGASIRFAKMDMDRWDREGASVRPVRTAQAAIEVKPERRGRAPHLRTDPAILHFADNAPVERSLSAIIADVKRETMVN